MAENENKPGIKIVLIGLIFPIILVFAIDYSVSLPKQVKLYLLQTKIMV